MGTGLRPASEFTSRPDNATQVTADQGLPVKQDPDTGAQIQRIGIAGADADWGPEETTLDADDEAKIANPDNVGGTDSSAGIVKSLDSQNISVVYAWTDGETTLDTVQDARDDPNTIVEEPPKITDDTKHVIEAINTKSDHCDVFVVEESGNENKIAYTLNFH